MRTVRLLISGRVQGVGYREWARQQAAALGLSGWVRNLRDGRVEAAASGPDDQVQAFLAAVRRGPSLGRVDDVAVEEGEGVSAAGFAVRPTA